MLCSQSYFLDSYQHVAGWNLRESIRKKVVPILKYVYKLKLSSGARCTKNLQVTKYKLQVISY
jgi:hypothetical protein